MPISSIDTSSSTSALDFTGDIEADLTSVATFMRGVLVTVLDLSLQQREVGGACLHGSILLQSTIERFLPVTATIRGGAGDGEGGYVDDQGVERGHYWIEARVMDESSAGRDIGSQGDTRFIVDITADQFGGAPVTVMPFAASTHRYRPGDQALVDEHVAEEVAHIIASQMRSSLSAGVDTARPRAQASTVPLHRGASAT